MVKQPKSTKSNLSGTLEPVKVDVGSLRVVKGCETQDTFRGRFEAMAGGRPYEWAASLGLPKSFVTSVKRGGPGYRPRRRQLDQLAAATKKSVRWWLTGIEDVDNAGPPWKDSRSDEAIRHAVSESPNPYAAFEAMKKLRDATDLLQRLQTEAGHDMPGSWAPLLAELLFGGQITEEGARRVVEFLSRSIPK